MKKLEIPTTLEEVRELAFSIPDEGMYIKRKGFNNDIIHVEKYITPRKTYSISEGKVDFYLNANEYVIPYFIGIVDILKNNGFEEISSVMPFDETERIVDRELAKKWKKLEKQIAEMQYSYLRKYTEETAHAVAIPFDVARYALEIPEEGFRAYHDEKGIIDVCPCVKLNNIKREELEMLGAYNVFDGIAVVICVQVRTYLMRMTNKIKLRLQELGYKKNENIVNPLEGVREFVDPRIQRKFENL